MRDGEMRFDETTTVFKPDGQQQWHESCSVHPRSMRMSVDMASTIFPVHKHDVHCLHLSVPADVQEPDEPEPVTEEPKEWGKCTLLQQNKMLVIHHAASKWWIMMLLLSFSRVCSLVCSLLFCRTRMQF
jgi:hypothetical protein